MMGELKFNTDKGVREEELKPVRPGRISTKDKHNLLFKS